MIGYITHDITQPLEGANSCRSASVSVRPLPHRFLCSCHQDFNSVCLYHSPPLNESPPPFLNFWPISAELTLREMFLKNEICRIWYKYTLVSKRNMWRGEYHIMWKCLKNYDLTKNKNLAPLFNFFFLQSFTHKLYNKLNKFHEKLEHLDGTN